ncbi:helix-turn-helix domain-containing protein [Paracoccus sp. (in: a-proteobacteria)]|uniref:helix-turn-helix domain-containing protein n=1 Tax=Paracoccus sp. TaxID=267 RepID=UPI0028A5A53F|nr:helix-turn-helix domain-containing protein [Paracoccus sp. (in: a-proteobacteria)]
MTAEFYVDGKEKADEPFVYRLSGLDDVVLLNGFTRHETEYGMGVSIDHVEQLHDTIAMRIVTTKKEISPKEFLFLRRELGMTQDELGQKLGVDGQTVARYEKGTTSISGPADRLIRVLAIIKIIPEEQMKRILIEAEAAVARDDRHCDRPAAFRENHGKWEEVCYA